MTYDIKDSYTNSGSDDSMVINVMRDSGADKSRWNLSYETLKSMTDEIHNNMNITTGVRKIDTDINLPCGPDDSDLRTAANNWLDDNYIYWSEVFLWIVGPCSQFIATSNAEGWTVRSNSFLGAHTRSDDTAHKQSTRHEALHPYLLGDANNSQYGRCQEVVDQVLNNESTPNGNSDDHCLGEVTFEAYGSTATSPMLGFYEQNTAEVGDCDYWEPPAFRNTELSHCTHQALELSRQHANGNH